MPVRIDCSPQTILWNSAHICALYGVNKTGFLLGYPDTPVMRTAILLQVGNDC